MPPFTFAPAAKLAEVAQLSIGHQDWETALAAAQDLGATHKGAAAQVVADIMSALQAHGGSISAVAAGMALLRAANQHEDTVKARVLHCSYCSCCMLSDCRQRQCGLCVPASSSLCITVHPALCACASVTGCAGWLQLFDLLEAHCAELLQPDHLHMAFLAWLHLGDTTAAADAISRHEPLAAAWSAAQQQLAFKSALSALNQSPFAYASLKAALQVWLLAVSTNLPDRHQRLHDLLTALLSKDRLLDAHKVGNTPSNTGLISCSNTASCAELSHIHRQCITSFVSMPDIHRSITAASADAIQLCCPLRSSMHFVVRRTKAPCVSIFYENTAIKLTPVCLVLQLLQKASQYGALQADAIEPVLAAILKQGAVNTSPHVTAVTQDLLAMLKQSSGDRWPIPLRPATASLLAEALLQEPGQPDVTHLFEARSAAEQVWLTLYSCNTCT